MAERATSTTRKYDAWGGFVGGTAPTSAQPSVAYAGQAFDVDLGLSYAQQRWYDSATGRFLSVDPVGVTAERLMDAAGLGWWSYAEANSVRFVDPLGLYRDNPQAAGCAEHEGERFAQCMQRALALHAREEQQGKISLEQQQPLPAFPDLKPYAGPMGKGPGGYVASEPLQLSIYKSGSDLFHEEQARRKQLQWRAAAWLGGAGLSIAVPAAAPLLLDAGALGSTGMAALTFGANTASGLATEYGSTGRVTWKGATVSAAFGAVPLLGKTPELKAAERSEEEIAHIGAAGRGEKPNLINRKSSPEPVVIAGPRSC